MLIYPKTKKGVQKDSPVWKEDNFLRLRGLADALVHKTDFKTEDGKNVLAGAYYERVRRELETLEAAKLAQLSKSLGPKAAALKAMPEPTGGSSNSSSPRSTGARRAAREAGERRARAASDDRRRGPCGAAPARAVRAGRRHHPGRLCLHPLPDRVPLLG